MQRRISSEIKYSDLTTVFEGIVVGPVIKILREIEESYIPKREINNQKELNKEIEHVRGIAENLIKTEEYYIKEGGVSQEIESISRSYVMMIKEITEKIIEEIKEKAINAEYGVINVIDGFAKKVEDLDDDYLKERVHDLYTIRNRFLAHLMEKSVSNLQSLASINPNESYILVSDEIMPSDFSFIKKGIISGIIHGKGGQTSHVAIIARSLEIPTIVGVKKILSHINDRDIVILDSYDGIIYINPEISTLRAYKKKKEEKEKLYLDLIRKTKSLRAVTKDQVKINLLANIEVDSDAEKLQDYGTEGVGLYRTEFLFLEDEQSKVSLSIFMDEEKQFDVYKKLAEMTSPKPIVIRTLDIARNHIKDEKDELNPFLGLRSIRYCLVNSGIFKTQIRAILRASHYGYVRIMIPMVTNIEEVYTVKTLIEEVKKELMIEEIFFDEDIEVGVMIEVPSAALIADLLAEMVDFISLGTNDLLQYTLAVDRSSPDVNYLYNPFSIAFFRLLEYIVNKVKDKPFYICGEVVSDPLFLIFAIGLGIKGFSANIYDIPIIKNLINNVSYKEAHKLVKGILKLENENEIKSVLHNFYDTKLKELE